MTATTTRSSTSVKPGRVRRGLWRNIDSLLKSHQEMARQWPINPFQRGVSVNTDLAACNHPEHENAHYVSGADLARTRCAAQAIGNGCPESLLSRQRHQSDVAAELIDAPQK